MQTESRYIRKEALKYDLSGMDIRDLRHIRKVASRTIDTGRTILLYAVKHELNIRINVRAQKARG